jgi:hypothetical protein
MKKQPQVPWYYWPFFFFLLALGLLVFYVILTPVWMGIRLISWLAERRNLEAGRSTGPGAAVARDASERARDST